MFHHRPPSIFLLGFISRSLYELGALSAFFSVLFHDSLTDPLYVLRFVIIYLN